MTDVAVTVAPDPHVQVTVTGETLTVDVVEQAVQVEVAAARTSAVASAYLPASAADWDPDPSTVAAGLDQLAGRVAGTETGLTTETATRSAADAALSAAVTDAVARSALSVHGVESLLAVGDSRLDYGSLAEGGSGRPYILGRLAAALAVDRGKVLNTAHAGSTARWGGWHVFQEFDPGAQRWPYSARVSAGVVIHGGNDAAAGTDVGGWREASFKAGLTSEILRARVSRTYHHDDASIVYTGSWATQLFTDPSSAPGQGAGWRETATSGAKATITTPTDLGRDSDGQWIDLYLLCSDTGATGEVWLDGTKHADIDIGLGVPAGTAVGHGYGDSTWYATIHTHRVWVPWTGAAHTVEVRFGAQVSGGTLKFNGWAIEAETPPVVAVANVVQIANTSVYAMGGVYSDPTVADTYSSWVTEAVATIVDEVGDPDLTVLPVDINTPLGGALGTWTADGAAQPVGSNRSMFLTDGIHTNHVGSRIVVDAVVAAVVDAIQDGSVSLPHLAGSAGPAGELDPLTESIQWHVGAGTPVDVVDTFDRGASEWAAGGAGVELVGAWGVDDAGQLYCVDPLFAHYAVRDDFERTSASELGSVEADSAGAPRGWVAQTGVWGTTGAAAYLVSHTSGHSTATIELGSTTQAVEAQITYSGAGEYAGLVLRWVDAANYLLVTGNNLSCRAWKMVAGVKTLLGTFGGAGVGSHPRVEIGADDVLRCWNSETGVPSSTTFTVTDAALLSTGSGTRVGLWVDSAATPSAVNYLFDEFKAGMLEAAVAARTAGAGTLVVWEQSTADGIAGIVQGWYGNGGLTDITQGAGIAVRVVDAHNHYFCGVTYYGFWALYRVVAGVSTWVGTWWCGNSPGVTVHLAMDGDRFQVLDAGGDPVDVYDSIGDAFNGLDYLDDTGPAGTMHGVYEPYHDGPSRARWADWRFGQALTVSPPRRSDMRIDTTWAPEAVDIYGPYDPVVGWGSPTRVGLTAAELAAAFASQSEVDAVAASVSSHLSDASDAHDASAVSVVPSGGLVATDAQSALVELDADVEWLRAVTYQRSCV